MKARHLFITVAAVSILVSCIKNPGNEQQSLAEISKQELATALNERDQLLSLVKEVSKGLDEIKQLESIMSIAASKPGESTTNNVRILADITSLKEKIKQRKAKLAELEDNLQESTINNKELKETINAIRKQMDSQIEEIEYLKHQLISANEQIGLLNHTVDSLNATVSEVSDERDAARQTSAKLENELNICYYMVATKSELKKHNIIESGFLRKTKLMNGNFDKASFEVSDKRMLTHLPLNSTKIKILTNHPATSFEVIEENGEKVIKITNPDLFWSLTTYLVVQID